MKLWGKAGYSIIFVSRGFLKIPKPFILLGSRAFVYLFPLNSACGLGGDIIEHAVDAIDLTCNSCGDFCEDCVRNLLYSRCHCILCVYGTDNCRPSYITAVILYANALHIRDNNKILPYCLSKTVFIKLFSENGICFSKCIESVTGDCTETSYAESGKGERLTVNHTV